MRRLLEELAFYLHNEGLGIYHPETTGGNIFLETLPADPDECIGIYTRGGLGGDVFLETTTSNIQFIIRNRNKLEALDIGYKIVKKLCGFNTKSLVDGGYQILDINAPQGVPVYLDVDKAGRHEYSINFEVEHYIEEEI